MSFKPHTREAYADDHLEGITGVSGVESTRIVDHDDEWLVATFEYRTYGDVEAVYERIVEWFTSEAHRPSFTGLDGNASVRGDDRGRFAVHYPR